MSDSVAKPYYQRVSYRLLKRMFGTIKVKVGDRRFSVPLVEEAGLYLLHWKYSWKTKLISGRLERAPGALIDVGANVGQTLFDFLYVPTESSYYGFEPNVACAAYLARVIRVNQLTQAHLIPAALGRSAELASIHIEPGSSSYASDATLTQEFRPNRAFQKAFIACYPLDTVMPSLGIAKISMVKIDAEHAELLVLEGMKESLRAQRPPICCEVLHRDKLFPAEEYDRHLAAIEKLLQELDYRIYHLVSGADDVHYQLRPLQTFPRSIFTAESYSLCDYLFLPADVGVGEFL